MQTRFPNRLPPYLLLAPSILVVVVDAAVDVQKLGPGQDGLELVQDETVVTHRLVGRLA